MLRARGRGKDTVSPAITARLGIVGWLLPVECWGGKPGQPNARREPQTGVPPRQDPRRKSAKVSRPRSIRTATSAVRARAGGGCSAISQAMRSNRSHDAGAAGGYGHGLACRFGVARKWLAAVRGRTTRAQGAAAFPPGRRRPIRGRSRSPSAWSRNRERLRADPRHEGSPTLPVQPGLLRAVPSVCPGRLGARRPGHVSRGPGANAERPHRRWRL
jgi:hypothetical protein